MDIKTADRLQELRKSHGYSQEALSEKLGVSRQAVSKWERGESSPDTDNLIALANIYGITLDDILNSEKEIISKRNMSLNPPMPKMDLGSEPAGEKEHTEKPDEKKEKKKSLYPNLGKSLFKFPFALVVAGIYVVMNLVSHNWHPSWIMFILIPIYYHFAGACFTKTSKGFLFAQPVPEIVILSYLVLGFISGLWGAGAILFIIIPLYYWGVAFYKSAKRSNDK